MFAELLQKSSVRSPPSPSLPLSPLSPLPPLPPLVWGLEFSDVEISGKKKSVKARWREDLRPRPCVTHCSFLTVRDQSSKKIDEIRVDQWNTDTLVEYFQERLA